MLKPIKVRGHLLNSAAKLSGLIALRHYISYHEWADSSPEKRNFFQNSVRLVYKRAFSYRRALQVIDLELSIQLISIYPLVYIFGFICSILLEKRKQQIKIYQCLRSLREWHIPDEHPFQLGSGPLEGGRGRGRGRSYHRCGLLLQLGSLQQLGVTLLLLLLPGSALCRQQAGLVPAQSVHVLPVSLAQTEHADGGVRRVRRVVVLGPPVNVRAAGRHLQAVSVPFLSSLFFLLLTSSPLYFSFLVFKGFMMVSSRALWWPLQRL